ncbi:hypothetical protein ACR78Z_01475 [Sphingobacterium thalpophilum]|uniref:hypothetical protein n=1 Tax=Sphingobacterium thalpophilum TaxID=259 RepID=UPI003DA4D7E9
MENNNTKKPYSAELASSLLALTLILALMYVTQGVLLPVIFSILIAISLFLLARFLKKNILTQLNARTIDEMGKLTK